MIDCATLVGKERIYRVSSSFNLRTHVVYLHIHISQVK